MTTNQSEFWAPSEKVDQRSQGRINKIELKAKESNHTILVNLKQGTDPRTFAGTKVVVSVNCTCNRCGYVWVAKPNGYIRALNGCKKCSHRSLKGFDKIETKTLYQSNDRPLINPDRLSMQDRIDKEPKQKREYLKRIQFDSKGTLRVGWYKNLNKQNAYFKFIAECQALNQLGFKGFKIQKHHIIPEHFFKNDKSFEAVRYMNSKENLIDLTVEQHIKAHLLLNAIYQIGFDKAAVAILLGDVVESQTISRLEGGQLGRETMKRKGISFHDPEKQKEFNIIKHNNKIIFDNENWVLSKNGIEQFTTWDCGMTADIRSIILNDYGDDLGRTISNLVKGKRKTSKGWSMVKL